MYKESSVGVVVPAYNEENQIGKVISTMPAFVDRIYVVDDGSEDGTWEEIKRHTEKINSGHTGRTEGSFSPTAVTIRHKENKGVGAAVKTGYNRALRDGIDIIAVMDGDGQMDPDELDKIVDPVATGKAAYAKGTRLHRRRDRVNMSKWRLFGNWLLTMLTRVSSGYWDVTDSQNGYRAISREALETIPFETAYDNYGFLNDMLAMLNVYRFPIMDVSHAAKYGDEESTIDYWSLVPGLSEVLLTRFIWRLKTQYFVRGFHPVIMCYPAGLGATLTGMAAVVYAIVAFPGSRFLGTLTAASVTLIGFLVFVLGMWFDIMENDGLIQSVDTQAIKGRYTAAEATPGTEGTASLAIDGGHTNEEESIDETSNASD